MPKTAVVEDHLVTLYGRYKAARGEGRKRERRHLRRAIEREIRRRRELQGGRRG